MSEQNKTNRTIHETKFDILIYTKCQQLDYGPWKGVLLCMHLTQKILCEEYSMQVQLNNESRLWRFNTARVGLHDLICYQKFWVCLQQNTQFTYHYYTKYGKYSFFPILIKNYYIVGHKKHQFFVISSTILDRLWCYLGEVGKCYRTLWLIYRRHCISISSTIGEVL